MDYQKGEVYDLKVTGVTTGPGGPCFLVDADGVEYEVKQFRFQQNNDNLPKTLSCMVTDVVGCKPVFHQNIWAVLKQLYQEANVYTFKVYEDCTADGYYELIDVNGLRVRLYNFRGLRLPLNSLVACLVTGFMGYYLKLELAPTEWGSLPFLSLADFFTSSYVPPTVFRWFRLCVWSHNKLLEPVTKLYSQRSGFWAIKLASVLPTMVYTWMLQDTRFRKEVLTGMRNIYLYLIERSTLLGCFTDQQCAKYRRMFSNEIQRCEDYLKAYEKIEDGSYGVYVKQVLASLASSGYLYQPERKIRILKCILSLKEELLQDCIPSIFLFLTSKKQEFWLKQPFRFMFVGLIDMYQKKMSVQADAITDLTNNDNRQLIRYMVTGLALEQLLILPDDNFSFAANRSRLYRYASMLVNDKNVSAALLSKAYKSFFSNYRVAPEYRWNDIVENSTEVLCHKMAYDAEMAADGEILFFNASKAKLRLTENSITLYPSGVHGSLKKAFPDLVLPWNNMQVLVENSLDERVFEDTKDLTQFQRMWLEVERTLFSDVKPTMKHQIERHPDQNEEVWVRITGKDYSASSDHMTFFCKIEEPGFVGEGTVNLRNIVRYNLNVDERAFCDSDGRPFLLPMTAKYTEDDRLTFDATQQVGYAIDDTFQVGDRLFCKILCRLAYKSGEHIYQNLLCLAADGFSVVVDDPSRDDLFDGDLIEAEILNINEGGKVKCRFVKMAEQSFPGELGAFKNMLSLLSEGERYEEPEPEVIVEEEGENDSQLTVGALSELVSIIDRQSLTADNQITTYNYLAFDRLLSLMMDNYQRAAYYSKRMEIVMRLWNFSVNGKIDIDELQLEMKRNMDLICSYPDVKDRIEKVLVVSKMDTSWKNTDLWEKACSATDNELARLTKLVLAYNMLADEHMPESQQNIKIRICELLNLSIEQPETVYLGEEEQMQEFKTSIVYPADSNMQPAIDQQTKVIVKVVCGFLNAKGGILYIGVNNQGVVQGLSADFQYFGGNGSLDLHSSQDKFDLHLRNSILRNLGSSANELVEGCFEQKGGKWVYKLYIRPSREPVRTLEGVYYERQGTSSVAIRPEDVGRFKLRRAQIVAYK